MVAVIRRHIPKTKYLGTALLTSFMALSAYANPVSESPSVVESESHESAIAAQTQSEQQAPKTQSEQQGESRLSSLAENIMSS